MGAERKKNARKKAAKKRKEKEAARIDVDESIASAIVAHVPDIRDRLALGCVSRVWRKVAGSYGSWGTFELVLDGELGKRLTDARLQRLI